jgi:hypothetical protein
VTTTTKAPDTADQHTSEWPVPEFVDWALAVVIGFGGLLWIVGGSALAFLVDRAMLAEGIEGGTVSVTLLSIDLTEAELLEVTSAVVSWTGSGLMLIGLALVLFAIGYAVRRHRTKRRHPADGAGRSFGSFAVLGALVSVVLSFLPFSPALGGALAGYLELGESERTITAGALSGLLAILPFVGLGLFTSGGLVAGLLGVTQPGLTIFTGLIVLLSLIFATAISAGLGAIGGYTGGMFASRRTTAD